MFYNIAGGIVHKIRSEKRTTTSEVIVRGKRIKHKENWFYFNFSVESWSFKFSSELRNGSRYILEGVVEFKIYLTYL